MIDWDSQPLGEMSDCALARKLGVSQSAVSKQRGRRGISPHNAGVRLRKTLPPWAWLAMGIMSDERVGQVAGVGGGTVWRRRREKGIPSAPSHGGKRSKAGPPPWFPLVAGACPAKDLAVAMGKSTTWVETKRRAYGLPAWTMAQSPPPWVWLAIGVASDALIGDQCGRTEKWIGALRRRNGIGHSKRDWGLVDWSRNNVAIARDMRCSTDYAGYRRRLLRRTSG